MATSRQNILAVKGMTWGNCRAVDASIVQQMRGRPFQRFMLKTWGDLVAQAIRAPKAITPGDAGAFGNWYTMLENMAYYFVGSSACAPFVTGGIVRAARTNGGGCIPACGNLKAITTGLKTGMAPIGLALNNEGLTQANIPVIETAKFQVAQVVEKELWSPTLIFGPYGAAYLRATGKRTVELLPSSWGVANAAKTLLHGMANPQRRERITAGLKRYREFWQGHGLEDALKAEWASLEARGDGGTSLRTGLYHTHGWAGNKSARTGDVFNLDTDWLYASYLVTGDERYIQMAWAGFGWRALKGQGPQPGLGTSWNAAMKIDAGPEWRQLAIPLPQIDAIFKAKGIYQVSGAGIDFLSNNLGRGNLVGPAPIEGAKTPPGGGSIDPGAAATDANAGSGASPWKQLGGSLSGLLKSPVLWAAGAALVVGMVFLSFKR